jgi:phage gp46-like protein
MIPPRLTCAGRLQLSGESLTTGNSIQYFYLLVKIFTNKQELGTVDADRKYSSNLGSIIWLEQNR